MIDKEYIRVLYVNGGLLDRGGISTYMINFARYLKRKGILVDYIVHGDGVGEKDYIVREMGSNIYHVPIKSKNFIMNFVSISRIIRNGNYKIVHSHMDAGNAIVLSIAKLWKVPIRISHSHNTNFLTDNKFKIIINKIFKKIIKANSTNYFACSKAASMWLYDNNEATIINNAIKLDNYYYNSNCRHLIRKKYDLEDKFVIGHVGRFDYQKNHLFMLNLFFQLVDEIPNAILMFIGDGLLRKEIEDKSRELHINDKIIFIGAIDNVNDYYNAMDMFLFPSKFEGLGISLIEAQVNGLNCVVSNNIPDEAKLSSHVITNSLNNINLWIESIKKINKENKRYILPYESIKQFDIFYESDRLANIYMDLTKNNLV